MGVTGLWSVLQPCARPIKLETLNRKRLAIDASIWIYQFLKAVRDKEGHALRNAHVVGFFRRVCKLLFVGVKPVFVFDGGAPALKRETVQRRRRRREGRREDAVRTAGKLLGVQMRRRAELEREAGKRKRRRPDVNERFEGEVGEEEEEEEEEEEGIKEGEEDKLVYVDELQMTPQERVRTRHFKKTDAYHLPAIDSDEFHAMGAPNDPRIMSQLELEEYARQFHSGEDINIYDFSSIDFDGLFFRTLPAGDRYNILNAARLRSRLRMGYSKEQLDSMFPDRMAFSRFQIDRVKERNELTQRLMGINGMNGEDSEGRFGASRVAGEKGKEYVLVKNDGVEGGWALGVVSNKVAGGEQNQPIDVDVPRRNFAAVDRDEMDLEDEEDEGFEDVPIAGLNRLPKLPTFIPGDEFEPEELIQRRQALYKARQKAVQPANPTPDPVDASLKDNADSLFVPQASGNVHGNASSDEEIAQELFEDMSRDDSDDDLSRAIAMSLEQDEGDSNIPASNAVTETLASNYQGPKPDERLEFNQENAQVGRNVAQLWNARARGAATALPRPFLDDSDEEGDAKAKDALTTSRVKPDAAIYKESHSQPKLAKDLKEVLDQRKDAPPIRESTTSTLGSVGHDSVSKQTPKFDGPLPFESLKLGNSLLRKKKPLNKVDQAEAGGFEKPSAEEAQKPPQPPPPWFTGAMRDTNDFRKSLHQNQYGDEEGGSEFRYSARASLRKAQSGEVIDLDSLRENTDDVVEVISSGDEGQRDPISGIAFSINDKVSTGSVADRVRAKPSESVSSATELRPVAQINRSENSLHQDHSDTEVSIEWEESDVENKLRQPTAEIQPADVDAGESPTQPWRSISSHVKNNGIEQPISSLQLSPPSSPNHYLSPPHLPGEQSIDGAGPDLSGDDEDRYSDPEEAELMRQLAIEAEEHARFASTLNSKSQLQTAEDYEKELRQLRNQQKKDRRDADEVSQVMITECQQLLRLFGIPYITAPMEAEAQCAELVSLGLVDGVVTDDSDIFLFGGTRVYKNMFNQAKYVECYLSSDLEKEYSLDRHKLIGVAHLLGSDYTEGVPSVGPVTALEILSEFENLEAFAAWWSQLQLGNQKLPAKEDAATTTSPFRRKFRRTASKIFLPTTFPDKRVDHAYLNPEVDHDPSPFAWGVPDLDALRQFLMATIGWSPERTDEVLVPVIKDMNRREDEGTQANITRFFDGAVGTGARTQTNHAAGFAPRRRAAKGEKSKRLETALGKLHATATATATRKRKPSAGVVGGAGPHESGDEVPNNDEPEPDSSSLLLPSLSKKEKKKPTPPTTAPKTTAKKRRKRPPPTSPSASNSDPHPDPHSESGSGNKDHDASDDTFSLQRPTTKSRSRSRSRSKKRRRRVENALEGPGLGQIN